MSGDILHGECWTKTERGASIQVRELLARVAANLQGLELADKRLPLEALGVKTTVQPGRKPDLALVVPVELVRAW